MFPKTKPLLGFEFSLKCAKRVVCTSSVFAARISWASRLSQWTKSRAFKAVGLGDVGENPSCHCLSWISDPCMVLSRCPDVSWLLCFGYAISPYGGEGSGEQHWRVTLTGTWQCRDQTGGSFRRATWPVVGTRVRPCSWLCLQLGFCCHWEELWSSFL